MKMVLKKIIIDNFKGISHGEYNLATFSRISGMNGVGKTTIADAWMWLFFDKNYALASNPNIRPNDGRECIPTVTAILDVDGVEISAAKMQKMRISKPDDAGVSKVTITNSYEINSVPKNQKDFVAYFTEHGVDLDKMLFLSNPDVFMGKNQADMRKMLFSMASEKTDQEIAGLSQETSDVFGLLQNYKMDEITAMEKASKKKAQDQLDAIPNQIIGLEKAKVEVDAPALEAQKKTFSDELEMLKKKKSDKSGLIDDLQTKAMTLHMDKNAVYAAEKDKLSKRHIELSELVSDEQKDLADTDRGMNYIKYEVSAKEDQQKQLESKLSELGKKFNENEKSEFSEPQSLVFDESAWVFDDSTTICSLCGQKLPESKIAVLKDDFTSRKFAAKEKSEKEIERLHNVFTENKAMLRKNLIEEGNRLKKQIQEIQTAIKESNAKLPELTAKHTAAQAAIDKYITELNTLPKEPDTTANQEYQKLVTELESVEKQISDMRTAEANTEDTDGKKQEIQEQIDVINKQLAQVDANARIETQITELETSVTAYEQAKADAEKILYQLDLVSKRKNELLTDEINKHFEIVKWKLFNYMKNGNYEECCIPVIDGKEYGIATNTGREILAKLDIVYGLQRFFGQYVPVWLDNAESLNSENLLIDDSTQLITMNVSDDAALKVEV